MAKVNLEKFKNNAKSALSKKETHGIFKEQRETIQTIPLAELAEGRGLSLRLYERDLTPLRRSIERLGQLEPVVVCKTGDGYEVLNGHRRVAVARATGRADVAAEVVEIADEEAPLMPYLLNAPESFDEIEIALFLRRLVKEHGMDEAFIEERTGLKVDDYRELFFDPDTGPIERFNAHFEGLLKRYFRIVRGELDIEKNGVRLRLEVKDPEADDATKAEIYRCIWRLSRM